MKNSDLKPNPLYSLPFLEQSSVPELGESQVLPLWQLGFYDGVLSGVCDFSLDNSTTWERGYFINVDELYYRRTFAVLRLTPELAAELEASHKEWQERVGLHCDYVWDAEKGAIRGPHVLRSQESQAAYFADSKAKSDLLSTEEKAIKAARYQDLEVVGWFTLD